MGILCAIILMATFSVASAKCDLEPHPIVETLKSKNPQVCDVLPTMGKGCEGLLPETGIKALSTLVWWKPELKEVKVQDVCPCECADANSPEAIEKRKKHAASVKDKICGALSMLTWDYDSASCKGTIGDAEQKFVTAPKSLVPDFLRNKLNRVFSMLPTLVPEFADKDLLVDEACTDLCRMHVSGLTPTEQALMDAMEDSLQQEENTFKLLSKDSPAILNLGGQWTRYEIDRNKCLDMMNHEAGVSAPFRCFFREQIEISINGEKFDVGNEDNDLLHHATVTYAENPNEPFVLRDFTGFNKTPLNGRGSYVEIDTPTGPKGVIIFRLLRYYEDGSFCKTHSLRTITENDTKIAFFGIKCSNKPKAQITNMRMRRSEYFRHKDSPNCKLGFQGGKPTPKDTTFLWSPSCCVYPHRSTYQVSCDAHQNFLDNAKTCSDGKIETMGCDGNMSCDPVLENECFICGVPEGVGCLEVKNKSYEPEDAPILQAMEHKLNMNVCELVIEEELCQIPVRQLMEKFDFSESQKIVFKERHAELKLLEEVCPYSCARAAEEANLLQNKIKKLVQQVPGLLKYGWSYIKKMTVGGEEEACEANP